MQYTKQVRDVHRWLAPQVRIDSFVEALNPHALGLEDRAQFYAPIAFGVQISGPIGGAAGAIRVEVPIRDDWLPLMKSRFARMIGMPTLRAEEMEFRTVTGKPLQNVAPDQLAHVGKLNLFVQGELLRMPELPPIPVEYSTNKMRDIGRWIAERVETQLPHALSAALLRHCTASGGAINTALLPGGPVEKAIQEAVAKSGDSSWTEFVRTRNAHSPDTLSAEEAHKSAAQISREILVHLRTLVESAAPQLRDALGAQEGARQAAEAQRKAGSADAHLYAPLLGATAATTSGSAASIQTLLQGLAEDTCTSPALHKAIAGVLHNRTLP